MVFKFKYWAIPYLGAVFFVGTTQASFGKHTQLLARFSAWLEYLL
jgi:hypothetical protein